MCFKRVCSINSLGFCEMELFTMPCAIHRISNVDCVSKEVLESRTYHACINNPFANYAQKQVNTFPFEGSMYKLSRHHEPE